MPKYLLKISSDPIEFEADHPGEFLTVWRKEFRANPGTPEGWRRTAAMFASDWCGKPMRFHSVDAFVWDMFENGLLEEVHEEV